MSMNDQIADMLTRIRNAQSRGKTLVTMSATKLKVALAKVLKEEGYITEYAAVTNDENAALNQLIVTLKYHEGRPVITHLARVSKPSLRVYRSCDRLPKVMGGLGIAIVSTSEGVMSDRAARRLGKGGEVICVVS